MNKFSLLIMIIFVSNNIFSQDSKSHIPQLTGDNVLFAYRHIIEKPFSKEECESILSVLQPLQFSEAQKNGDIDDFIKTESIILNKMVKDLDTSQVFYLYGSFPLKTYSSDFGGYPIITGNLPEFQIPFEDHKYKGYFFKNKIELPDPTVLLADSNNYLLYKLTKDDAKKFVKAYTVFTASVNRALYFKIPVTITDLYDMNTKKILNWYQLHDDENLVQVVIKPTGNFEWYFPDYKTKISGVIEPIK